MTEPAHRYCTGVVTSCGAPAKYVLRAATGDARGHGAACGRHLAGRVKMLVDGWGMEIVVIRAPRQNGHSVVTEPGSE